MTEEAKNPYQVLGIERTADERAIKKAYFTLIRQFPPESHPEEFKRIRGAYEVLTDPVARRRFDAMDKDYGEYGEEIGAALRDVEESAKAGDDAEVQRKLALLVEQHPDLGIARENLLLSYMRTGAFDKALAEAEALLKKSPEEVRYYVHKAYALHRLEKPKKAESALRKAHRLRPEDLRIHIELVDLLIGYGKRDEAIAELDELLEKHEGSDIGLILRIRRVEALSSSGIGAQDEMKRAVDDLDRDVGVQEEVTRIIQGLDRDKDPELPRFVANQLASVAARLFARQEIGLANALLERCRELHPTSPVLRPYPARARLDVSALPEEGRRWLASLEPGPSSPMVARPIWPKPVAAFLGAALLAALTVSLLFYKPGPWTAAGLAVAALGIAASVAALALSVRRAVRILRSPLRAFTTIHPLYLIQVDGPRVDVRPLFHLADVRAAHHHHGQAYTHTDVTLRFRDTSVFLRLKGQGFAEGWLNFLLSSRGRAIELMGEGYLEAEQGIDLLPPALLTDAPGKGEERARDRRFYAAIAVAALAAWAIAIPLHARAADDEAFRMTVRRDTIEAYQAYLAASPEGRYAAAAREEIARRFEGARAAFRAVADPDAPGAGALLAALAALEARGDRRVRLVAAADAEGIAATAGARREALAERLNRVLAAAGLDAVMEVQRGAEGAPVVLEIRSRARPDGHALEATGAEAVPSIHVDWDVRLTVEGTGDPLLQWSTSVPAPDELRLPRGAGRDLAASAHARLEELALEALVLDLAGALGLKRVVGAATQPRRRGAETEGASHGR